MGTSVAEVLLVVAEGRSYGRGSNALDLIADLERRGFRAHVVAWGAGASRFRGPDHTVVPDHARLFARLAVDPAVERCRPDAIVLCDAQSVTHALASVHDRSDAWERYGAAVLGIDTWVSEESGEEADLFGREGERHLPWPTGVERIVPAPLARPAVDRSCGLVLSGVIDRPDEAHVRCEFGLPRRGPLVLLTTAPWQHEILACDPRALPAWSVLEALCAAVTDVDDAVLVHVGPEALSLGSMMGTRYCWLATLRAEPFHRIVASADLMLALSPIASTMARALVQGVPVLRIHNPAPVSLKDGGNLHAFEIWPLGYANFLAPVLRPNPMCRAVQSVGFSERQQLTDAIRALAVTGAERTSALERQAAFAASVCKLPSVADRVAARCGVIVPEPRA